MFASLKKKETYTKYFASLKYALYCITHPLDGFWDLTHEKRGSIAAANTILIITVITKLAKLYFTGFMINTVYWPEINIFMHIAAIVFPLALFCVGNWGLTTLFDGKGRLPQIYMATCYAFTPYPLLQIPLIFVSNVVTAEEAQLYHTLSTVSLIWAALLIVAAMIQIHEYSVSKTVLFLIASLFAMLVIVFVLLSFFSMITQGLSYFVSMYREMSFRL